MSKQAETPPDLHERGVNLCPQPNLGLGFRWWIDITPVWCSLSETPDDAMEMKEADGGVFSRRYMDNFAILGLTLRPLSRGIVRIHRLLQISRCMLLIRKGYLRIV